MSPQPLCLYISMAGSFSFLMSPCIHGTCLSLSLSLCLYVCVCMSRKPLGLSLSLWYRGTSPYGRTSAERPRPDRLRPAHRRRAIIITITITSLVGGVRAEEAALSSPDRGAGLPTSAPLPAECPCPRSYGMHLTMRTEALQSLRRPPPSPRCRSPRPPLRNRASLLLPLHRQPPRSALPW